VVLGRLAGKWLRYSGMLLVRFPQIVPERRCPMLGLCHRWKLVRLLGSSVWSCFNAFFGHDVHVRLSLVYFARSSVA